MKVVINMFTNKIVGEYLGDMELNHTCKGGTYPARGFITKIVSSNVPEILLEKAVLASLGRNATGGYERMYLVLNDDNEKVWVSGRIHKIQ